MELISANKLEARQMKSPARDILVGLLCSVQLVILILNHLEPVAMNDIHRTGSNSLLVRIFNVGL
jgi:hypothetical protein